VTELRGDYDVALSEHLANESEGSLVRAYDLGRQALARGFGILDALSLYDAALREVVLNAPPEEHARLMNGVTNFFRELFSPFEMSLRGYRETNKELQRVNADLQRAYTDLQDQQLQLVQAAKMASLGQLVAGIAHELNNPVSFVLSHLGTVQMLLQKIEGTSTPSTQSAELWSRARRRLEDSQGGVSRIRDLVSKLRTFSRLDEGERKISSIRENVNSVLMILEHRLKEGIVVETSFGEPDLVDCFPGLLNQAIMNLITNAIDAAGPAGTIRIATYAEGGDYVIAVTDSGPGIPDALRERVFEPFFTTKPVGEGTGLGLSITYSIVQRHHGTLELAPAEGGGTRATIRFPLHLE